MAYFELLFLLSTVCIAVNKLTRKDAVFGYIQKIAADRNGESNSDLWNPVFNCVFCMASLWTFGLAWLSEGIEVRSFLGIGIMLSFLALGIGVEIIRRIKIPTLFYFVCLIKCTVITYEWQAGSVLLLMLSVSGFNYVLDLIIANLENTNE